MRQTTEKILNPVTQLSFAHLTLSSSYVIIMRCDDGGGGDDGAEEAYSLFS